LKHSLRSLFAAQIISLGALLLESFRVFGVFRGSHFGCGYAVLSVSWLSDLHAHRWLTDSNAWKSRLFQVRSFSKVWNSRRWNEKACVWFGGDDCVCGGGGKPAGESGI
jgi:hypothetical protein